MIGDISRFSTDINDVVYVVYTERFIEDQDGKGKDVTRIISARLATSLRKYTEMIDGDREMQK